MTHGHGPEDRTHPHDHDPDEGDAPLESGLDTSIDDRDLNPCQAPPRMRCSP